jgi:uncharacterized protein (TIGR02246 family)
VTSEIAELERRGWEALSGPEGAAFYANLMDDDGLMVFPGLVLDRAASLRAIAGAPPWNSFDLDDVREIRPTPDSAIVTYRASARRDSGGYVANMTSVYGRRDGRWRLLLHQQTPIPDAG